MTILATHETATTQPPHHRDLYLTLINIICMYIAKIIETTSIIIILYLTQILITLPTSIRIVYILIHQLLSLLFL